MCKKDNLLLFVLLFIVVGLFASMTPFSDIDHDGLLDPFGADEFFLLPVLLTVTGLFFLLTELPSTCFAVPKAFSTLLVPPPITN
jgi:hypothetical protein